MIGHDWKFKTDDSWKKYRNVAKDTEYDFAPSLDADVRATRTHYTNAEAHLGTWDLVGLNSDPACSSAGCV